MKAILSSEEAWKLVEDLVWSGDPKIFEKARGPDGSVNEMTLVNAMIAATDELLANK